MRCSYNESAFVLITQFYRQILRVIQFNYLLRNINELRVIEIVKLSLTHRTGRKLTSALSKAGRGNGTVQRHQDLAEILLRPCFDPQPFQPPTPSHPTRYFQTSPSHRPGRVVSTCSLKVLDCRFFRSDLVSLTMPEGVVGYARRNFMTLLPCFANWEAFNAYLEEQCRKRQGEVLRGHAKTIGERLEQDLETLTALPPLPFDACDKVANPRSPTRSSTAASPSSAPDRAAMAPGSHRARPPGLAPAACGLRPDRCSARPLTIHIVCQTRR